MKKHRLAIFASGTGSNALRLMDYFQNHPSIEVACLVCNKADAPIVTKTQERGLEVLLFGNESFEGGLSVEQELDYRAIDFVILAGFLRKISPNLVRTFKDKIVNIHPSLLPKYGGKGMYGMNVHKAVLLAGEDKSGITIHLVNEEYDKGRVLGQFSLDVNKSWSPEELAKAIAELEHQNFAKVIEAYIAERI